MLHVLGKSFLARSQTLSGTESSKLFTPAVMLSMMLRRAGGNSYVARSEVHARTLPGKALCHQETISCGRVIILHKNRSNAQDGEIIQGVQGLEASAKFV